MTDFYTQRLSEKRKEKEARVQRTGLPMGKPQSNNINTNEESLNSSLRAMASDPNQPQPETPKPKNRLQTAYDTYAGRGDGFKEGMEEFVTIIETMKKDLEGINLPPEVMQRRVEDLVNKYATGSQQTDFMKKNAVMSGGNF